MTAKEHDHLIQLHCAYTKRLRILELKKAKMGLHTPEYILTEIDDILKEVATIDVQLNGATPTTSSTIRANLSCAETSAGETNQIDIVFKGNFDTLTEEIKQQTVRVLAALVNIEPDQIKIVKVMEGSIIFRIEMPKEAAKRLLDMYQVQDTILEDIDVTEIREVLSFTQPDTTLSHTPSEAMGDEQHMHLIDLRQAKQRQLDALEMHAVTHNIDALAAVKPKIDDLHAEIAGIDMRLAAARSYVERVLDIRERILDPNHPNAAESLNTMGYLLRAQGNLEKAQSYFQRALKVRERTLGADHPLTVVSLYNLGNLLQDKGDLKDAQPYFQHALDIRERVLGPDHPLTIASLYSLGNLLRAQGNLEDAQIYFQRALDIRKQVLGPDHPDTALSLYKLGNLVFAQGDLEGARAYYQRALDISKRILGPSNRQTNMIRESLDLALDPPRPGLWYALRKLWKQRR